MNVIDKIDKFEALESQTVADFESIFKTTIPFENDDIVEIGNIVFGEKRELIINGKEVYIRDLKDTIYQQGKVRSAYCYKAYDNKGKLKLKYYSLKEMLNELDISIISFKQKLKDNDKVFVNNPNYKKIKNIEVVNSHKFYKERINHGSN